MKSFKLSIVNIFGDQNIDEANDSGNEKDDSFKLRVIHALLENINEFVELYINQTISFYAIFKFVFFCLLTIIKKY